MIRPNLGTPGTSRSRFLRLFPFALLLLTALVGTANAAGSYKLKSATMAESGGAWHLWLTIQLPAAPPTPHVSMKFIFTKTAAYELSLVDGHDGPVENKTNLAGQLATIEPQDVDFSDGTGKIFAKTTFDFNVTRSRGYGPGEYRLQVKTSDGTDVGGTQVIVLNRTTDPNDANAKADIVDRRSISFDPKNTVRKVDNGVDAGTKATTEGESAAPTTGDVAPAGSAGSFIPDSAYQPTPEELGKDHPKGCGCSVLGHESDTNSSTMYAPFAIFGLGVIVMARRRSRRRTAA